MSYYEKLVEHKEHYAESHSLTVVALTTLGYNKETNKKVIAFVKGYKNVKSAEEARSQGLPRVVQGIAMLCGKRSNVMVFDVDDESVLETLNIAQVLNEDTPYVKTRKGYHFYFSYDDSYESKNGIWFEGTKYAIDLLSDDRQVILPPSRYQGPDGSNHEYTWVNDIDEYEVMDLPDYLKPILAGCLKAPPRDLVPTRGLVTRRSPIKKKVTADDTTEIAELVNALSDHRAEDYDDWLKLGICLKNVGAEEGDPDKYLELWDQFSQRSPQKYDPLLEDRWNGFELKCDDGGKLSTGSLIYKWLQEDNPSKYTELQARKKGQFVMTDDILEEVRSKLRITKVESLNAYMQGYKLCGLGNCPCGQEAGEHIIKLLPSDKSQYLKNLISACNDCNGKLLFSIVNKAGMGRLPKMLNEDVEYGILDNKRKLLLPSVPQTQFDLKSLAFTKGSSVGNLLEKKPMPMVGDMSIFVPELSDEVSGWYATRKGALIRFFSDEPPSPEVLMQNPDNPELMKVTSNLRSVNGKCCRLTKNYHEPLLRAYYDSHRAFLADEVGLCQPIVNFIKIDVNINIYSNKKDDNAKKKRMLDEQYAELVVKEKIFDDYVIKKKHELYAYNEKTRVWKLEDKDTVALEVSRALVSRCSDTLNERDLEYLSNDKGPGNIVKRLIHNRDRLNHHAELAKLIDSNPYLVPFKNAVFDLQGFELRPIAKTDYVSETVSYSLRPRDQIPQEDFDFVALLYRKILPYEDDKEFFVRLAASCLPKLSNEKVFVVLTDQQDGNNGKSTIMDAISEVFDILCCSGDTNFLYENSNTQSVSNHAAGIFHYEHKNLAVFEETDRSKQLNASQLKKITSGGKNKFCARAFMSPKVETFQWTATPFIVCNDGEFSKFRASDSALLNRMKVVPFRSRFEDCDQDDFENNIFKKDKQISEKITRCREAHFYYLLDAYQRYLADGFGEEPEFSTIYKQCLIDSADSLQGAISEFIDDHIVRSDKEQDIVQRKTLIEHFRIHYKEYGSKTHYKSREVKKLCDQVMVKKNGFPFVSQKKVNSINKKDVYTNAVLQGCDEEHCPCNPRPSYPYFSR